ncbi:MAG: hypothetical protein KGD63_10690 [Candidatus Lokiarchaeota archaeon]|nr:hypothetical protein [Candidatus Lokiarchaeota archaeon]
MKFLPACETCVKSGFLCTSCQKKLDEDKITSFELDLAKDLLKLEENVEFGFLEKVSFFKAIDYEDVVIIVIGRGDKIRITQVLINWIIETYELEKIILIEKSKKPIVVIESLITPGKVNSLNEIFLATGDTEYRAVLQKQDTDRILFTKEELEELVLELTDEIVRIEYN